MDELEKQLEVLNELDSLYLLLWLSLDRFFPESWSDRNFPIGDDLESIIGRTICDLYQGRTESPAWLMELKQKVDSDYRSVEKLWERSKDEEWFREARKLKSYLKEVSSKVTDFLSLDPSTLRESLPTLAIILRHL